ncbi:hypothetical protein H0A64_07095 [Alcaligenaceae bacterium]|nr:hypothetical protein [Alcaligenaceae bacterium]
MMKIAALCALLAIAGCTTVGPRVAEGNQSTVVVDWAHSTQGSAGALAAADAHCAQYGKHAQYSGKPNAFQLAYDCIK